MLVREHFDDLTCSNLLLLQVPPEDKELYLVEDSLAFPVCLRERIADVCQDLVHEMAIPLKLFFLLMQGSLGFIIQSKVPRVLHLNVGGKHH